MQSAVSGGEGSSSSAPTKPMPVVSLHAVYSGDPLPAVRPLERCHRIAVRCTQSADPSQLAEEDGTAPWLDLVVVTGPVLPQRPKEDDKKSKASSGAGKGKGKGKGAGSKGGDKPGGKGGSGSGDGDDDGSAEADDLDAYGPEKAGDFWEVPGKALQDCEAKIRTILGGELISGNGRISGLLPELEASLEAGDPAGSANPAGGDALAEDVPNQAGTAMFLREHLPHFVR